MNTHNLSCVCFFILCFISAIRARITTVWLQASQHVPPWRTGEALLPYLPAGSLQKQHSVLLGVSAETIVSHCTREERDGYTFKEVGAAEGAAPGG